MEIERQRVANKRSKSQIKRLLNELRYYKELYEETSELFNHYDLELNQVLEDITSIVVKNHKSSKEKDDQHDSKIALLNKDSEKIQNCETSQETKKLDENIKNEDSSLSSGGPNNKPPAWMKSLFKKIAIECHPDKIENREDLSLLEKSQRNLFYKKASNAIETIDKVKLLEVGYALDIFSDISEKEQKDLISSEIEIERNKVTAYHSLVSWVWGENEGKIEIRSNLLVYIRSTIGLPQVSQEIIEKYVKAFESGEDLAEFKKQYINSQKTSKRIYRKIGERPAPSFKNSRKKPTKF